MSKNNTKTGYGYGYYEDEEKRSFFDTLSGKKKKIAAAKTMYVIPGPDKYRLPESGISRP